MDEGVAESEEGHETVPIGHRVASVIFLVPMEGHSGDLDLGGRGVGEELGMRG